MGFIKYALLTDEGTAAAETVLCRQCINTTVKESIEVSADSDVVTGNRVDVTDNNAIRCMNCGRR